MLTKRPKTSFLIPRTKKWVTADPCTNSTTFSKMKRHCTSHVT